RIIDDEEIKHTVAAERPYREWLEQYLGHLEDLSPPPRLPGPPPATRRQPRRPIPTACCSARWPSVTASRTSGCCSRRWHATASRPWGRWATTRRWRCSRIGHDYF